MMKKTVRFCQMKGNTVQDFQTVLIFVLWLKSNENSFHRSPRASHDSTSVFEIWRKDTSIGTLSENLKWKMWWGLCSGVIFFFFFLPRAAGPGKLCANTSVNWEQDCGFELYRSGRAVLVQLPHWHVHSELWAPGQCCEHHGFPIIGMATAHNRNSKGI